VPAHSLPALQNFAIFPAAGSPAGSKGSLFVTGLESFRSVSGTPAQNPLFGVAG